MTPYEQGEDACRKGVVVGDNPYHERDAKYWEWMNGWVNEAYQQRGWTK